LLAEDCAPEEADEAALLPKEEPRTEFDDRTDEALQEDTPIVIDVVAAELNVAEEARAEPDDMVDEAADRDMLPVDAVVATEPDETMKEARAELDGSKDEGVNEDTLTIDEVVATELNATAEEEDTATPDDDSNVELAIEEIKLAARELAVLIVLETMPTLLLDLSKIPVGLTLIKMPVPLELLLALLLCSRTLVGLAVETPVPLELLPN